MSEARIFDRNTILKIVLGIILGGLAVYLAFQGVSFSQLGEVITSAAPWMLAAGIGTVLINVALLALRWWLMLLREWQGSEYKSLLGGVYLGQMFNILLPARLGELARIYFVSERIDTTKSRLLGSLVLEKVIDVITFGLALLLLITAVSLPAWVSEPGKTIINIDNCSRVVGAPVPDLDHTFIKTAAFQLGGADCRDSGKSTDWI